MGTGARVLITSQADLALVAGWSSRAASGSVIVLAAQRSELAGARRKYAALLNVMVSPGDRHEIPWGDGRFNVILDEAPDNPTPEMRRVLAPEGTVLALQNFSNGA
jgi:hypothetical protein